VFLRQSEDERLVVAFYDGDSAKTVTLSLQGTPAEGVASVSGVFGKGRAELASQQLKLVLPSQSFSVFKVE